VSSCSTITWVSSTSVLCTLVPGAAADLSTRYSFQVKVSAAPAAPMLSRHSSVEVRVIPVPVVVKVKPNNGPVNAAQTVTLKASQAWGFGTGGEPLMVEFGLQGSVAVVGSCSNSTWLNELRIACTMPSRPTSGQVHWFRVTVGSGTGLLSGVADPSGQSAVNTYQTVGLPMLTGVCPPGSRNVGGVQRVTLMGTDLGNSAADVRITAGATGTEFICGSVQYLESAGAFACVLPAHMPAEYGNVRFRISVRGQTSAVSSFAFVFTSTAPMTEPNLSSNALIDSVLQSSGLQPSVAGQSVTLRSSGGTFGQCAEQLTGVYTATVQVVTATGMLCSSFEWLSPFEIRCGLDSTLLINTRYRFQLAFADGGRSPLSAVSVYAWTLQQVVIQNPPSFGFVESVTIVKPSWSISFSQPYRIRLVVTLNNSNPVAAAAGGLPQTATILFPLASTTISWPYSMPARTGNVVSAYSLTVDEFGCDSSLNSTETQACLAYIATAFVPTVALRKWQWRPASVTTTLAGPGGCSTPGIRNGVQRTDAQLYGDDLPLLGSTILGIRASDQLVYVQDREYAGIRVFDRRTRTLTNVSGDPMGTATGVVLGANARWDFRATATFTNAGMGWDGSGRYIYLTTYLNMAVARIDLLNGSFAELVYSASHTACSCTYPATCPASCYTPSDATCGTDARLNTADVSVGLQMDPRGRYFYIVDSQQNSLRRVDTATFCPTTLMAPSATKPSRVTQHSTH